MRNLKPAFVKSLCRKSYQSLRLSLLLGLGALPFPTPCQAFSNRELKASRSAASSLWAIFKQLQQLNQDSEAFYQAVVGPEHHPFNPISMAWVTEKLEIDGMALPEEQLSNLALSVELKVKDLSNSALRLQTPRIPNLMEASLSDGLFEFHAFGDFRGTQAMHSLIELLQKKLGAQATEKQVVLLHMLGILLIETDMKNPQALINQLKSSLLKDLEAAQQNLPQIEKSMQKHLEAILKRLPEVEERTRASLQEVLDASPLYREMLRAFLEAGLVALPQLRKEAQEALECMKKSLRTTSEMDLLKGIERYLSSLPDFKKPSYPSNGPFFISSHFQQKASGVASHQLLFGADQRSPFLKIHSSGPIHHASLPGRVKPWIQTWGEGTRIIRLELKGDSMDWEGFFIFKLA